jgi:hypothetical protein
VEVELSLVLLLMKGLELKNVKVLFRANRISVLDLRIWGITLAQLGGIKIMVLARILD